MRRVLMVSPHFPPDTTAGAHRARLLAPHLHAYGWEPTVVSIDPRDYEGRLDPELESLMPRDLRVIRCRAWPVRWTRSFGVGDLGLRALWGLDRTCSELLRRERFDALWITILPGYPSILGRRLKRRFGIPFVMDYQDPWVGAWGLTVGPGHNGSPNLKSRLTRKLSLAIEPRVLRWADAITAVSSTTYEQVRERFPDLEIPGFAMPLGGEAADFEAVTRSHRRNPFFDPGDGNFHLCYVGTLLPLGFETLRGVLQAVRILRDRRPDLHRRLRLHFFGTSNQTAGNTPDRVLPVARELGVMDSVTEVACRVNYLDALTIQTQASAILLMGSTERHYTASKLFPGLLSRKPLLAVYHEASSVVDILQRTVCPPSARLVVYDDARRAGERSDEIFQQLTALLQNPAYATTDVDWSAMEQYSAKSLAGKLAEVLDRVALGSEHVLEPRRPVLGETQG